MTFFAFQYIQFFQNWENVIAFAYRFVPIIAAVNCNNSINMYDYSKWQDLAESVATNEVIFASAWKMSSAIQVILEHVSETHGKRFLGASQKNIQQLCR